MTLETETVLDRRRLKRKLSLWRVLAILAAVAAVGALVFAGDRGLTEPKQIARVAIEGVITEDRDQLRLLKRIAEAGHVHGVIVFVNSPGGTTAGGEALFEGLRQLAEKKPLVAQFGTVAASAAYIAGLGTDHIVARGNTITGSVGVIMQWPEFSQLLDKVGVKMNEVRSGPLKANPSPFQPLDEAGRRIAEQMIAEGQRWFVGLVGQRRGVATADIPGLEQGRVYSGREALNHKLVDEIGGEAEAVRWLEETRKVVKGLKVIDWKPRRSSDWSLRAAIAQLGVWLLGGAAGELSSTLAQDPAFATLGLDGLISVWHPSKN